MGLLPRRYARLAGLANQPSPSRRAAAALVAGVLAFALTQLCLGAWWGVGRAAVMFSAVAMCVAAVTTRRGPAVVYGVVAALWLLLELLVAAIGCIAAGIG